MGSSHICMLTPTASKSLAGTLAFMALATAGLSQPARSAQADSASACAVTINAAFAGGNVKVTRAAEDTVHVERDLRGDNPWFYWCFEATAVRPGRITFVFPEEVAGFENGAIGYQGPAISRDRGRTWTWMGTENVRRNTFFFDFAHRQECVRFAVTIPYLQANLDEFLEKHTANPHLAKRVLTKSRHGRDVELLRIGASVGEERQAVLVTCRHHAAETMASFVLEGFLCEAMSESGAGQEFRRRYVLYAVPFVDKDGVEEGDQGKNRKPHDHNRDYGTGSIYPEVRAIKELAEAVPFQFALDFHCPTLVMKGHQVMYFAGAKAPPQHNFENVSAFARWITQELPDGPPYQTKKGALTHPRGVTKKSPFPVPSPFAQLRLQAADPRIKDEADTAAFDIDPDVA